jgi:predicted anti-sigma-YlaC factor YlaD
VPEPTRIERGYACQEVVELASEYLEGAMTPEQMTRFELHLNLCDGCYAFLEQVRTTSEIAGLLPEEQIPEEIKTQLLAAFRDWKRE